jgi:hypothetical protein
MAIGSGRVHDEQRQSVFAPSPQGPLSIIALRPIQAVALVIFGAGLVAYHRSV